MHRRRARVALTTLALLAGCEAAPQPSKQRFTSTAMGVVVEITIDDDDADHARAAARSAQLELDRLDAALSDWKESSELSQLNRSTAVRIRASDDLRVVLARALEVCDASGGRFDPTVGPFVTLWRQTRRAGGFPPAAAHEAALAAARSRVGCGKVRIDGDEVVRESDGIQLDFGGIGKGYGAVRALEVLRACGCPRALVAVAGDLAAGDAPRGARGWVIDIEAESGGSETVTCANQAVSTSGGSVQWVEIDGTRYAHIVDPRTGLGATDLAQVTVVGPLDAAVDALGTALALCANDDEVRAVLAHFDGYRARVERNGAAHWVP